MKDIVHETLLLYQIHMILNRWVNYDFASSMCQWAANELAKLVIAAIMGGSFLHFGE